MNRLSWMSRWFNWGAFLSAMIMLTLLYFFEIQPRDKTIARLEAERDSLDKELFQAKVEIRHWRETVQRKEEWDNEHFRLYHRNKHWPPDTPKHKPMKRREK